MTGITNGRTFRCESNSVSEAWEALTKTLKAIDLAALSFPSDRLNWTDGN
jgi:hypothetical protein